MAKELVNVAVVGATGAVGEVIFRILGQRKFPVGELYPLASARSMGKTIDLGDNSYPVIDLEHFDFAQCQIAFFSAGGSVSKKYVPRALEAGCYVIDNTSEFRMQKDVPLIVADVNDDAWQGEHLIANPNCVAMGLLVALKPLHDKFGIRCVRLSTYQAVSGAGKRAISSLSRQTMDMMRMAEIIRDDLPPFPSQIAFNVIPHIGDFEDNGYTGEEQKVIDETKKILADQSIGVSATCVRVPVFYGHSMAVNVELEKKWSLAKVRDLLHKSPGLKVKDSPRAGGYPTPIDDGGKDDVVVGRIRQDLADDKCLTFWLVSDNLRKGAALNAVQLAELLLHKEVL